MPISIVIPVLNEEKEIRGCLRQFDGVESLEIVVADGGSTDATRQIVEADSRAIWVVAPRAGRAIQMNAGARVSTGDILLFLHSDTRLPENGTRIIQDSLADPCVVGGRFELGLSESTLLFRIIGRLSTLRSKYLGITYGDQGIYVRRSVFESVGGYPDQALFEDLAFARRVKAAGRFTLLEECVETSTRRWRQGGVLRTVVWMWLLLILYRCGVPHELLARWYREAR